MFLSDIEIIFLLVIVAVFSGFYTWIVLHSNKNKLKHSSPEKRKSLSKMEGTQQNPSEQKISVFESFDYMGTKIYHNNGKYTVVEDNVSRNFRSINELPSKYRKMILEMESKSFSGKKNRYYMENRNGKYFVLFPDGSEKKYKSYKDIPEKLKKILSN